MNQLNSIILEGNVVKKAELSEPATGFIVCRFPLAVNRKTKAPNGDSHEEVSFFDIETYGKTAELCSKFCDKGKGIRVVGRLKQSRWEENNVKKSKVYVIAEHIEYKYSKPKPEEENKPEEESAAQKSEEVINAEKKADNLVNQASEAAPQTEETAVF